MPVTTAETTSRSMGAEATDQLARQHRHEPSIGDAEGRAPILTLFPKRTPTSKRYPDGIYLDSGGKIRRRGNSQYAWSHRRLSNPDLSGVFQNLYRDEVY